MKKILALTIAASALLVACLKTTSNPPPTGTCTPVAPSAEDATIKTFCQADTIGYTKDTSNIYYHISDTGTGAPAATTIFFTYRAATLNGTLISQTTTPYSSPIVNLIQGFKDMARFYKKGAHIIMVIPSFLAYSCEGAVQNGSYVVPPNTILYYDITITDVQ